MHFVRVGVLCITGVLAVFAFFQRQLMYPGSRAESLAAELFPELEQSFHRAADVELTTPDKVRIRGWHLQCESSPSSRLMLLFHGNGGHRAHRGNWYRIARSLNMDVLTIDYHGYGDSEGSPSEAALISDAEAAWKYAVEELTYQPSQIVILGESLGGGIGVQLAAALCRKGTPPAALVLVATFSSMLETASHKFWWLPVRFLLLDRYRSDLHIGDVTCPLIQFHGDQDTLIPLFMGQKLHELAPAASGSGRPRELHVLQGAGHNNILYLHGRTVRDKLERFLQ